jgi:L-threonylcarbamoyladenylate synthase
VADAENLTRAAAILKDGGVVAFPTETVYGLGADASRADAVAKIFALKGRPADHPLIVHIAEAEQLPQWAADLPPSACTLAETFWPGPLTLILRRAPHVPDAVTGGLETVGLRVPAHTLARELLRAFGGGIAAPSANRFGRVSPTTAQHVRDEFGAELPMILDGGRCAVGVESTIVDLSSRAPAILRPGGVTRAQLEAALGCAVPVRAPGTSGVRAPGTLESHYAPRARVLLCEPHDIAARVSALRERNIKIAVLTWQTEPLPDGVIRIDLPADVEGMARELYAALRTSDDHHCAAAVVALPKAEGIGAAIIDRLARAAAAK